MIANHDNKPDSQLYNDYGDLPRCELLRCYGYITAGHYFDVTDIYPSNFIRAAMQMSHSAKDISANVQTLKKRDLYDDAYLLCHPADLHPNNYDFDFEQLIHVAQVLSRNHQTHQSEEEGFGRLANKSLHKADFAALKLLCVAFKCRLSDYECHADQENMPRAFQDIASGSAIPDRNLLQIKGRSKRQLMALEIRIAEQRILRAWLQIFRHHFMKARPQTNSKAEGHQMSSNDGDSELYSENSSEAEAEKTVELVVNELVNRFKLVEGRHEDKVKEEAAASMSRKRKASLHEIAELKDRKKRFSN